MNCTRASTCQLKEKVCPIVVKLSSIQNRTFTKFIVISIIHMGLDIITTWVLIVVMSASGLAALVTIIIRFRKRCKKSVHHFRRKIRGTLFVAQTTSPARNVMSSSFCVDDAHLVPWGDGQPHQTSICLEPVPLVSEKEVQLDHSSICIEAVPIDNSKEVQQDDTLICLEPTLTVPEKDVLLNASLIFPELAPIVPTNEVQLDDTSICLESALIVPKKDVRLDAYLIFPELAPIVPKKDVLIDASLIFPELAPIVPPKKVQLDDTSICLESALIVPKKEVQLNNASVLLESALVVSSRGTKPDDSVIESASLIPKDEIQSKRISICPNVPPLFPKMTPPFPKVPPLLPKITPLFPKVTPLFPRVTPLFPNVTPLFPKVAPLFPKVTPLFPKKTPLSPTPNVEPDPLQINLNSLYVRNTPPIKLNSPTARLVRVKISPRPRRKGIKRSRPSAVVHSFQKFGIFSVSMMLMSDSHGRDISGIINEKMSLVKTSGFVYPNGTSKVVLERLPRKTRGFRVVTILVGTNDTGTDVDTAAYVGKALRSLADYQKPLVCSVPNRYDTDMYDDLIKAQNMGLKELCLHRNVVFLNLEKLSREDYTLHGLHLNLTGKIKLGDMLVKEIERMMVFRDRKTVKRDSRHRK